MTMPYDAQSDLDDDVLMVLFANGDRAAAQSLTARLTPRAFRHALRVLGDRAEAEDVAQDAMLRLWKVAPDWRQGEAQVTTWLYRVVANLCTDRLRRRKRTDPLDEAPDMADGAPGAEQRLLNAARGGCVAGRPGHLAGPAATSGCPAPYRRSRESGDCRDPGRECRGGGKPDIARQARTCRSPGRAQQ